MNKALTFHQCLAIELMLLDLQAERLGKWEQASFLFYCLQLKKRTTHAGF